MNILIRKAQPEDIHHLLELIRELADYERSPESVTNSEQAMMEEGFGERPYFQAMVAEDPATKAILGMAIYYPAYSTWRGKYLYLDDLYVREAYRRYGIGGKLLDAFLKEAKDSGMNLVKWQVLNWNSPAIAFYQKYGVVFDNEWIDCKLYKEDLIRMDNQIK